MSKGQSDDKPPRRRERFHGRVEREGLCARPGCAERGEFRAPVDGAPAGTWQYFCLDHVREFNEGYRWRGPGADAERQQRARWERTTRAFAANAYAGAFDDELGIFTDRFGADPFPHTHVRTAARTGVPLSPQDHAALAAFDLDEQASAEDIRARYKELVRRYHPDSNGGDRSRERELQAVIDAYTQLRRSPAFS